MDEYLTINVPGLAINWDGQKMRAYALLIERGKNEDWGHPAEGLAVSIDSKGQVWGIPFGPEGDKSAARFSI